jgi:hypothetical protein
VDIHASVKDNGRLAAPDDKFLHQKMTAHRGRAIDERAGRDKE